MNHDQALELVKRYVKNENSIKHMLAAEAIMVDLARRLNQEKDKWGLVGLLHDLDIEMTGPEIHGLKAAEILKDKDVDREIIEAIKAHNEATGKVPETLIEKAIFCTDPLTGLIVAAVLVLPLKKLTELTLESVLKRFKEKAFARGANRKAIGQCSAIGLDLEEFIKIGLDAMKRESDQLGL